ncbi:CaaX prenyl proteinase Rce1 [Talaromyces proteolyticus]|uniref:intramembrane prenyl-peptidase Rce1 n=1 Tax=Talaromyces proteolyticus TaxID=1131652 RepID=A0AAD4KEF0_9EURO|nr:CaaX prenyl proteinase Rce1 [Talaromyces proteolyticus]KAH8689658.1 CaaX prenyl proteinase Rce1 [Talaromyces proteolyticus]
MAPVGFVDRLRKLYAKQSGDLPPVLSVSTAAFLSILVTLAYVVPFYISKQTRPSASLSRDAPSVIRSRVRAVTLACIGSTFFMLAIITLKASASLPEALKLLGYWPIGFLEILKSFLLTAILFSGPLFERGIVERDWMLGIRGAAIAESLRSWIGFRNFVAGPITEEVIFRSIIISLHLLAKMTPTRIVFISPLYFGIAHVHHFYEFRLTHPDTPVIAAVLRSLFQFAFTTVFGWFAAFVYLRTGSLPAVILVHSFCNWCGLPRVWGRIEAGVRISPPVVRGKDDTEVSPAQVTDGRVPVGWTIAYYELLVAGAVGFYFLLWPLTESPLALASFAASSK